MQRLLSWVINLHQGRRALQEDRVQRLRGEALEDQGDRQDLLGRLPLWSRLASLSAAIFAKKTSGELEAAAWRGRGGLH